MIWKAIDYLDAKTAATILCEMYDLTEEIIEYGDVAADINCESRCYLEKIIKDNTDAFSEQELKKYEYITDIYD